MGMMRYNLEGVLWVWLLVYRGHGWCNSNQCVQCMLFGRRAMEDLLAKLSRMQALLVPTSTLALMAMHRRVQPLRCDVNPLSKCFALTRCSWLRNAACSQIGVAQYHCLHCLPQKTPNIIIPITSDELPQSMTPTSLPTSFHVSLLGQL